MAEHMQHSSKNGFPTKVIQQIKEKETAKLNTKENKEQRERTNNNKKWVTFTYYSTLVRKVTNLFKNIDIRIAFRTNNTIYQPLGQKTGNQNPSGIYEIKCNTCGLNYVGQSDRPITTRHKEHIRYIKNNNPA
jgi:hypothetical protein